MSGAGAEHRAVGIAVEETDPSVCAGHGQTARIDAGTRHRNGQPEADAIFGFIVRSRPQTHLYATLLIQRRLLPGLAQHPRWLITGDTRPRLFERRTKHR